MSDQPELFPDLPPPATPSGIFLRHNYWWFQDTQAPRQHGPFLTEDSASRAYTAHCERVALARQVPALASGPALRICLTPQGHLELSGDGAHTVLPITSTTGQEIARLLRAMAPAPDLHPQHQFRPTDSLGVAMESKARAADVTVARAKAKRGVLTLADLDLE